MEKEEPKKKLEKLSIWSVTNSMSFFRHIFCYFHMFLCEHWVKISAKNVFHFDTMSIKVQLIFQPIKIKSFTSNNTKNKRISFRMIFFFLVWKFVVWPYENELYSTLNRQEKFYFQWIIYVLFCAAFPVLFSFHLISKAIECDETQKNRSPKIRENNLRTISFAFVFCYLFFCKISGMKTRNKRILLYFASSRFGLESKAFHLFLKTTK